MKHLTIIIVLTLVINLQGKTQIQVGETELDTTTIINGLDIPWEIQWGPDNHLWTTERFGRVSRIDPTTGSQYVILDLSDIVYQSGESGLLGLVLHPDFENEAYVYLAYTYKPSGSILERIVRYTYDGFELVDEYILLDNIPGNTTHDGCRLIILPDNTLLITTGDAQNQPASQDLNHLSGKVLRLNLDGSIPEDNPFENNPVYSYGHRNAQGLILGPNGVIYSSEHGPSTDDELNIIEAGRNYGWPIVRGYCDQPGEEEFCENNSVYEPLVAWTPTVATSDIVYYDHPSIPEWQDHILMTTLKNKRLYALQLDEDGNEIVSEEQYFIDWWGRLRDICIGPDGAIYLATNGPGWTNTEPFTHKIIKLYNPDQVNINVQTNHETDVRVFPNPNGGQFSITISEDLIGYELLLHAQSGGLVYHETLDSKTTKVNIIDIKPGVYLLSIARNKNTVFTDKILFGVK